VAVVAAERGLQVVEHAVEAIVQVVLMVCEQQDGDRQQREHDEVQGTVDCDRTQDDLVAQRLASQRKRDLIQRRQVVARRLGRVRRRQRQPAVAAQAAVPALAVVLADEWRVFGPDLADVEADKLVAVDPAGDELPVKTRYETPRFFAYADAGKLG
jgi:hypothetical protein